MDRRMGYSLLLIGGRSGVGKTTVAWEVSAQLRAASVAHCLYEAHVARSKAAAKYLQAAAPPWVHRIPTDTRSVVEVADEIVTRTGWRT